MIQMLIFLLSRIASMVFLDYAHFALDQPSRCGILKLGICIILYTSLHSLWSSRLQSIMFIQIGNRYFRLLMIIGIGMFCRYGFIRDLIDYMFQYKPKMGLRIITIKIEVLLRRGVKTLIRIEVDIYRGQKISFNGEIVADNSTCPRAFPYGQKKKVWLCHNQLPSQERRAARRHARGAAASARPPRPSLHAAAKPANVTVQNFSTDLPIFINTGCIWKAGFYLPFGEKILDLKGRKRYILQPW